MALSCAVIVLARHPLQEDRLPNAGTTVTITQWRAGTPPGPRKGQRPPLALRNRYPDLLRPAGGPWPEIEGGRHGSRI